MPAEKKKKPTPTSMSMEDCHETMLPVGLPTPAEMKLPERWFEQPEKFMDKFKRESICGGADDSQDVELYDGTLGVTQAFVTGRQRPVGQLQWNNNLASIYTTPGNVSGVRWCSGTLISRDLFLTAGHCFDQNPPGWQLPRVNGTSNVIQPAEIATNMHVNFNYQRAPDGSLRPEQSFPILALVEYRLNGLDFAIIRLGGNPGDTYGWTRVATADAAVGNIIAIISHPAGMPKRIEAGPVTDLHGNLIGYNDIDTLGGSSGGGILSTAGRIVGVHTNGGCNPAMTGHNHGFRISVLLAASPTLTTIANNPPTAIKKLADDPGPVLKKPLDDPPRFKKLVDDRPFKKIVDDPRPKRFLDPPKGLLDPPKGAFDPGPIFPGPIAPGPIISPGIGRPPIAPFVLATPHHAGGAATEADAMLQIHAAIEQAMLQLASLHELLQYLQAALLQMQQGGDGTA